jgi:hypothetical protein
MAPEELAVARAAPPVTVTCTVLPQAAGLLISAAMEPLARSFAAMAAWRHWAPPDVGTQFQPVLPGSRPPDLSVAPGGSATLTVRLSVALWPVSVTPNETVALLPSRPGPDTLTWALTSPAEGLGGALREGAETGAAGWPGGAGAEDVLGGAGDGEAVLLRCGAGARGDGEFPGAPDLVR